jgi:hypothetical protein
MGFLSNSITLFLLFSVPLIHALSVPVPISTISLFSHSHPPPFIPTSAVQKETAGSLIIRGV